MGGSGGSFLSRRDAQQLQRDAVQRLEEGKRNSEINSYLQQQLTGINDRDVERVNDHLDAIHEALNSRIDGFDRLVFGGSLSKETYVEGLSDVDSLVLLKAGLDRDPAEVLREFAQTLRSVLPQGEIADIHTGTLAVTITYGDGAEIQLLPAVSQNDETYIAAPDGHSWSGIRPREFAQRLTDNNKAQGGAVIPAIKLVKAMLAKDAGTTPPSGYHLEALAIAAFRDYSGPRTPKAMVTQWFQASAENVGRPIPDLTGQSRFVDNSLGPANSAARQTLADRFSRLYHALSTSDNLDTWSQFFD